MDKQSAPFSASRKQSDIERLIDGTFSYNDANSDIEDSLSLLNNAEYMDRVIAKVSPYPDKVLTGGVFNACQGSLTRLSQFIGMDWRDPQELHEHGNTHGDFTHCTNDNYDKVNALKLDNTIFKTLGFYRQGSLWSVLHQDKDAELLLENNRRYWALLAADPQVKDITTESPFDVVASMRRLQSIHQDVIAIANKGISTSDTPRIFKGKDKDSDADFVVRLDKVQDHPEAGIQGDMFRDHSHVCSLDYLLNTYVTDDVQTIAVIDLPGVASQFLDMVEGYKISHFHIQKHVDNIVDILDFIYNKEPHRFISQADVYRRIKGKEFAQLGAGHAPYLYRIGDDVLALLCGGIALSQDVYEKKLLSYDFDASGKAVNNHFNIHTATQAQKQARLDEVMRRTETFLSDELGMDIDKLTSRSNDKHAKNIIIVSRREPSKSPVRTIDAIYDVMQQHDEVNAFIILNNAKRTATDGNLAGYARYEEQCEGFRRNPLFDRIDDLRKISLSQETGKSRAYIGTEFMPHERVMQIFAYLAKETPEVLPTAFGFDGYVLHGAEFETMRQIVTMIGYDTSRSVPVGSWDVGYIYELANMTPAGSVFTKEHTSESYRASLHKAVTLDESDKRIIDMSSRKLTSDINTREAFHTRVTNALLDVLRASHAIRKTEDAPLPLSETA